MTDGGAEADLVPLWLEKAEAATRMAEIELGMGYTTFAVGRLYYACFYAVTALHLRDGRSFRRHGQVVGEFNRCYVNTGKVGREWADLFRQLFDDRQEGDYTVTQQFEREDVEERLGRVREFIKLVSELIQAKQ